LLPSFFSDIPTGDENMKKHGITSLPKNDIELLVKDIKDTTEEALESLMDVVEHKGLNISRQTVEEIINNHSEELLDTYMTDSKSDDIYDHIFNELLVCERIKKDFKQEYEALLRNGIKSATARHTIVRLIDYSNRKTKAKERKIIKTIFSTPT
jgi:hypothetical protein